jgi:hypothetical protein
LGLHLVETVLYRMFASAGKSVGNPGGSLVDVAAVERFADSGKRTARNGCTRRGWAVSAC